ncbi:hypothetical protein [Solibacillus sp. FSL W7-1324]|uniref:hypothetical protein n=1 Tax=Solibacillus sp. FSL W7-1324 TaxID=2921701 RepID=UPI0030F7C803
MTIKINIEPNKNPVIERYENELKVGARTVYITELQKMFASDLPIDTLLSVLIHDRIDEFSLLLEQATSVDNEAREFVDVMLEYLNGEMINSSRAINVENILKHCEVNAENFSVEHFNELILLWSKKLRENQIDFSGPLRELISLASAKEMPTAQLMEFIMLWGTKLKFASANEELSQTHVSAFTELIKILLSNEHNSPLRKSLIKLALSEVSTPTNPNEMRTWLLNGVTELDQFVLEDELARRKNDRFTQKEARFFAPLPKNAVFMAHTNKGNVFYYDLPKNRYFTKFQSVMFKEKVGFPRLIFAITVNEHFEVIDAKLAAAKGKKSIHEGTQLYKYPFSNVFSTGQLCFNFKGIPCDELPDAFLSTSNNSHLSNGGYDSFKKYEGLDFDDETLTPLNVTVGEFY